MQSHYYLRNIKFIGTNSLLVYRTYPQSPESPCIPITHPQPQSSLHLFPQYHCCGTLNYTDWESTAYGSNDTVKGVPDSCCKGGAETNCGHNIWDKPLPPENIYLTPCYEALTDSARANTGAIIGGVVGLALLQVCFLGFVYEWGVESNFLLLLC